MKATRGLARATTYVADRLTEAQLQPVLADEYRMQVAGRVTALNGAVFEIVSSEDTLTFVWGQDFLVDARSASGSVSLGATSDRILYATGLDIPDVISESLVLLSDRSMPGISTVESGPLVLRILDAMQAQVEDVLVSPTGPPRFEVSVSKESSISTGIVHVAAMLPGAHPEYRDSLTVFLAALDGFGIQGGRQWTDGSDLGIPATALLETAARTAVLQRQWSHVRSSILFGWLSDTRSDCSGPSAFLRRIPWMTAQIRHVVFVVPASPVQFGCDWEALRVEAEHLLPATRVELLAEYDESDSRSSEDPFPTDLILRSDWVDAPWLDDAVQRGLVLARRISDRLIELDTL